MKLKSVIWIIAVNFILCEIVLAIFFHSKKSNYISNDFRQYKTTPIEIEKYKKIYDPELGWKPRFNSQYGERLGHANPSQKSIYAVTYGDSFTYGSGVENHQTWQVFQEKETGRRLLNFGVSGFGVDQALKYFLINSGRVPRAKYAVLAFIDDNLRRNMTKYRRILSPPILEPLTKPQFALQQDELVFLPNPIQTYEDLGKLTDDNFIKSLLSSDWYYSRYKFPEFPFMLSLFQSDLTETPFMNQTIRDLFKAQLNLFKMKSCADGQIPVVVRYPTFNMFQTNNSQLKILEEVAGTSEFQSICAELGLSCYFPLKEFEQQGGADSDFVQANGGHYAPSGNRLFAKVFNQYLSDLDQISGSFCK